MYYRARYYDPELEIFISQDPLGDAQRYVGGNPMGFVDPLGLDAFGVTVGVNGFAGIGAGAAGSISYTGAIFIDKSKGISFAVIPSHGGFVGGPGFGPSVVPQGYNPRKANTYNSQANFVSLTRPLEEANGDRPCPFRWRHHGRGGMGVPAPPIPP